MGYPVSYRTGANPSPSGPGFQTPANDNVRPPTPYTPGKIGPHMPPNPANDNIKRAIRTAGQFRSFTRINPWIRNLDLIIEPLLNNWQKGQIEGPGLKTDAPGYVRTQYCPNVSINWMTDRTGFANFTCQGGNPDFGQHAFPDVWQNPGPGGFYHPRPDLFVTCNMGTNIIFAPWQSKGYLGAEQWEKIPGSSPSLPSPRLVPNTQPWYYPYPWAEPSPLPQTQPRPSPYPDLDPLPKPGPRPEPKPLPFPLLPYRRDNPFLAPTERSQRGNGPVNRPGPGLGDGLEWNVGPNPKPGDRPSPVPNIPRQPPQGPTKEKKLIANAGAGSLVGKFVNMTTETLDVLDSFYEALPQSVRPKGRVTPQKKAEILYKNFDKIDAKDAIKNLIENQIEDLLYGKLGKGAQKGAKPILDATGRPVGLGTGPAL